MSASTALTRDVEAVQVPDTRFVHIFIAKGSADLEGAGLLKTGDAVRLTAAGGRRLNGGMPDGAEVLIWETDADLPSR